MNEPLEETISRWDDPARAEDTLGRSQFAERICRALGQWKSHESLIVAIYGPWGSGKTWLLHRIAKQIEHQSDVRVCRFTPWLFESDEQILAEFFAMVLAELEKKPAKSDAAKLRVSLFRNLARTATIGKIGAPFVASLLGADPAVIAALGPMADLLAIGENAATAASTPQTASQQRVKLTELFGASDAPRILVTIDDLDRLEDSQIRMIFRLIKTTANFPNLNYLVLGERKQLASALNEVASGDGDRYLEKIVQIPLTLPRACDSEIRGRLWEGLKMIAPACGYDLEPHRGRFTDYWDAFLNLKLSNYRGVHRLLTTVAFHAEMLTQDEILEVDLLDLLAIDFLRIFAPTTYNKLAADPINEKWKIRNRIFTSDEKEKVDSVAGLDLIQTSELGQAGSFTFLCRMFPGFYSSVPSVATKFENHLRRPHGSLFARVERPVHKEEFQSLYFELSLDASRLPSSEYERFLSTRDEVALASLLRDWGKNGWRKNLFNRLLEDVEFLDSSLNPTPLLIAVSSVSDELENALVRSESELRAAIDIWMILLGKVNESGRMTEIKNVFANSLGITIPLFVLEDLRSKAGIEVFSRSVPYDVIPIPLKTEVEALTKSLLPDVRKRFISRRFPVDAGQVFRLYRLASALGADELEPILTADIDSQGLESPWAISTAVARSQSGRLDIDLLSQKSLNLPAGRTFVEALLQFASAKFWRQFHDSASQATNLTEAETTVLAHIASGLREVEAGSPSNQGDNRQKGRKTKRSLAKNRKAKSTAPGSEQS